MFSLDNIIRDKIKRLEPYSSARDEFTGVANVFLDANENSLGSPRLKGRKLSYNRYPDPHHVALKSKLEKVKGVEPKRMFLGNGSDECIDILIRACCEPGKDNLLICPPTYGMYQVCADINDVGVKKVLLKSDFQLDVAEIERSIDDHTKIIFLCSPNNPTGNCLHREDIEIVLNNYFGLVVIDEAYINFSRQRSWIKDLVDYPNLVILQTLSKAWGLAALRIGMTFASESIISIMNKIKPPYNISQASTEVALDALDEVDQVSEMIVQIVASREELRTGLSQIKIVQHIFPSDANFLLVKVNNALSTYQYLIKNNIVVRDRSRIALCEGCLRITVGTKDENETLLQALRHFTE